jgi:hypothetical protein
VSRWPIKGLSIDGRASHVRVCTEDRNIQMAVTELETERASTEARIDELADAEARIAAQLEHARAHGDYNRHWAANAELARKAKARQRMQLERSLADINRRIRQERAVEHDRRREDRFMATARRFLPKATFDQILEAANI